MSFGDWLVSQAQRLPFGTSARPLPLAGLTLTVLDVNVTGINLRKDHVTGIATLPVTDGAFQLSRLGYLALPEDQESGEPTWREHYRALVDHLADQPVVSFNARFVKHMIRRATEAYDLPVPFGQWLDLALLMRGILNPDNSEYTSMAVWQRELGIEGIKEHDACSDVFVMAQLLQRVLDRCEGLGLQTLDDLIRAQSRQPTFHGL